jgi:GNAT superfamily N-acetyltransferase
MQNKRGISQALAPQRKGLEIRDATIFDAFDVSGILIGSIIHLCEADHGNDPAKMLPWLENKSPADVRRWLKGGAVLRLALLDGQPAAVGALSVEQGVIRLLYAAPQARGSGAGTALLADLEALLVKQGQSEARLTATRTARDFYRARNWQDAGPPEGCFGIPGYPMKKRLT